MTDIQINNFKKSNFFLAVFKNLSFWGIVSFSFFFNYKFIGGNNFLDFIIFLTVISFSIVLVNKAGKNSKTYHKVSDNKIKKIEEILTNEKDLEKK